MAAPTVTARTTPAGFQLQDGARTTIAFSQNPLINFWEQTVKPPSVDSGESINNTTMINQVWRTKRAPLLKERGEVSGKAMYDPDVLVQIAAIVGVEGSITIHYSTGDSDTFYGFLSKWEPDEMKEKEAPMAGYTVVVTNWDPLLGVEAGPVYTSAVGT